jgi:hypothetical protein
VAARVAILIRSFYVARTSRRRKLKSLDALLEEKGAGDQRLQINFA